MFGGYVAGSVCTALFPHVPCAFIKTRMTTTTTTTTSAPRVRSFVRSLVRLFACLFVVFVSH